MIAIVEAKPETGGAASDGYGLGILMALGAAFFYALAALAAKWLKGTPPHLIALIQVATGMLMLAPMTDFSNPPRDAGGWAILVTVGVVHTGLMYVLLYGAIQRLPTHLTGALSFIYPIAAILVDRLAFGHALQPMQIAGAAIILLAAAGMESRLDAALAAAAGGGELNRAFQSGWPRRPVADITSAGASFRTGTRCGARPRRSSSRSGWRLRHHCARRRGHAPRAAAKRVERCPRAVPTTCLRA